MFNKIKSHEFYLSPTPHIVKDGFMKEPFFSEAMSELIAIESEKRRVWSNLNKKFSVPKVSAPTYCFPNREGLEKYPMIKRVVEHFDSNLFYEQFINEWSEYFSSRFTVSSEYVRSRLSEYKLTDLLCDAAGKYVPLRDPHIDTPKAIIGWQYYCRLPDDKSKGGDLTLYSYKRGFRGFKIKTLADVRYLSDHDIKLEKTISYVPNRLVVYLNGVEFVHGVTNRLDAKISRVRFAGGI
ncbi:hypothetical protein OAT06_06505, partial [Nitrospinaceae bacterium]|nr:hypothetical protein [Nitrospinaceae bacterium]